MLEEWCRGHGHLAAEGAALVTKRNTEGSLGSTLCPPNGCGWLPERPWRKAEADKEMPVFCSTKTQTWTVQTQVWGSRFGAPGFWRWYAQELHHHGWKFRWPSLISRSSGSFSLVVKSFVFLLLLGGIIEAGWDWRSGLVEVEWRFEKMDQTYFRWKMLTVEGEGVDMPDSYLLRCKTR